MRQRRISKGLTVNAISGTHVIFFGFDLEPEYRNRFRGFALKRTNHSDGEIVWLRGMKTFKETDPNPAIGETFSTQKHPIQAFQWADYSVKPGTEYTYTIVCMYGVPLNLEPLREVDIQIRTESETGDTHSVFFNRGSVASQEYARRFQNKPPSEVGEKAYEWLSRGLLEALIKFIKRAKRGDRIYGAIYEFQWPEVLETFRQANDLGVNVNILFDDVVQYEKNGKAKGPWKRNREEISKAKIKSFCHGRSNARLMHNKFFVLCKGNNPVAVWTGSTNLTENGIFGHSNMGHIIEDETVAHAFMDYWNRLAKDPKVNKAYRDMNMKATPVPKKLENGTTTIFSPRETKLDSLYWYAELAKSAKNGLFMTFAFGMHEKFKEVFQSKDKILKMALMEKAFSSPSVKTRDEKDIQEIRNLPNVIVAIGNRIVTNSFDRWVIEMGKISMDIHVYWIHTKYMLVDPLGDEPILVTGSANFSKASTDVNDENMVVIKGDKRIVDIYLGEYMRLYTHYAFREAVKWQNQKQKSSKKKVEWKPQYLINDDNWMSLYFDKDDTTGRFRRREYFSGPLSS